MANETAHQHCTQPATADSEPQNPKGLKDYIRIRPEDDTLDFVLAEGRRQLAIARANQT